MGKLLNKVVTAYDAATAVVLAVGGSAAIADAKYNRSVNMIERDANKLHVSYTEMCLLPGLMMLFARGAVGFLYNASSKVAGCLFTQNNTPSVNQEPLLQVDGGQQVVYGSRV